MPTSNKDFNSLQAALVESGLCEEKLVVQAIAAKKNQAWKTRRKIEKIMKKNDCSKKEAIEILNLRKKG